MTDAPQQALTYEAATARLEEIIRRLDSGEAGLRETLELVKEGRGLVEFCAAELDAVSRGMEELRLDELVARLEAAPAGSSRREHLRPHRRPASADRRLRARGTRADVSSGFLRKSTLIHLSGGGEQGTGEDVTYDAPDHDVLRAAGPRCRSPASGRSPRSASTSRAWTRPEPPQREPSRNYRVWAYESAALDLALRQSSTSLHRRSWAASRDRSRSSARCGSTTPRRRPTSAASPSASSATRRCASNSTRRRTGTSDVITALIDSGSVDSFDFKGLYEGTVVDAPRRSRLLPADRRDVPGRLDGGPQADPGDRRGAAPAPRPDHLGRQHPRRRRRRRTPVRAADGQRQALALRTAARAVPDVRHLCGARDRHVRRRAVRARPGRGHIQLLASIFHPDTPNDVAPSGYNLVPPPDGLPASPLPVAAHETGLRWG